MQFNLFVPKFNCMWKLFKASFQLNIAALNLHLNSIQLKLARKNHACMINNVIESDLELFIIFPEKSFYDAGCWVKNALRANYFTIFSDNYLVLFDSIYLADTWALAYALCIKTMRGIHLANSPNKVIWSSLLNQINTEWSHCSRAGGDEIFAEFVCF